VNSEDGEWKSGKRPYLVVVEAAVGDVGEEAVGPDGARPPRGAVPEAGRVVNGLDEVELDA
jgi:hypothetical protein